MFKKRNILKKLIAIGLIISLGTIGAVSAMYIHGNFSLRESQEETLQIAVLSEPRVFPGSLISDSAQFNEVVSSDIAMLAESQAILDAAVADIIAQAPDVLLVPGNLTKDGEVISHEFLAGRLNQIRTALPEIHIYVINGARDVHNPNAFSFATSPPTAIASATPELFRSIYSGLGYGDATSDYFIPSGGGAGWGSYVARPAPGFTIMAIDTNTLSGADSSGAIGSELLQWIVERAQEAKERGDTVIAFMHHSLVPHSSIQSTLFPGTLLSNHQEVATTLANAGIRYVFTSALRATDINQMTVGENTLTDISTASLTAYPSPVRWATFTRGVNAENRRTEKVDISTSWIESIDFIHPLTGQNMDDLREHAAGMVTRELMISMMMDAGLLDVINSTLDELESATFTNTRGVTHTGLRAALESALPTEDEAGNPVSNCMGDFMVSVLAETLPTSYAEGIDIAGIGRLFYESNPGRIRIQLPGGILGGSLFITDNNFRQHLVDPAFTQLNHNLLVDRTFVNHAIDQMARDLFSMNVYPLPQPDGEGGYYPAGDQYTLSDVFRVALLSHLAGDEQIEPWMLDVIENLDGGGPLLDGAVDIITDNLGAALNDAVNSVHINTSALITASGLAANAARLVLIAMLGDNLGTIMETFGFNIDEMLGDMGDLFSEEMRGDFASLLTGTFLALSVNYGYPNDNFTTLTWVGPVITSQVDRTLLAATISEAGEINPTNYTPESWLDLEQALLVAQGVYHNENATQEEIDHARDQLRNAIENLVRMWNIDASGRDHNHPVSLTIIHTLLEDEPRTPVVGAGWHLYQVIVPAGEHWDNSIEMARDRGWISSTPVVTAATNSDGEAVLAPSFQGIFLAVNHSVPPGLNTASDFLVSLPSIVDNQWVYHVRAYIKEGATPLFEKEIIEEGFDEQGNLIITWEFELEIRESIRGLNCINENCSECNSNCVFVQITDTLDPRLSLDEHSVVVKVNGTILTEGQHFVLHTGVNVSGEEYFQIRINETGRLLLGDYVLGTLSVIFDTVVNSVACEWCDFFRVECLDCRGLTFGELVNQGYLEYGRNVTTRARDNTTVFGLEVRKINHEEQRLEGAFFHLYRPQDVTDGVVNADAIPIMSGTTDGNGVIVFYPLIEGELGVFYLVEITPPAGYQALDAAQQIIINEHYANEFYVVEVYVINSRFFRLPTTGGMGTHLFTIFGILFLGSAGLFYIKKDKKKRTA